MGEFEFPQKAQFSNLFPDEERERIAARNLLLEIEEVYIQAERYHDPTFTESTDEQDNIRFVDLDPNREGPPSRYLAESTGKYGKWKAIVRRDGDYCSEKPQTYSFESFEGDLWEFYRYMIDSCNSYESDIIAPLD